MGRAGLGVEIQKVKENPGSGRPLHRGVCRGGWRSRAASRGSVQGRLEETAGLVLSKRCSLHGCGGRSGLMGVRAGGLSPVLRVGLSPRGHRGQRGDRGDPGQGPALGLLAARGLGPGL